MQSPDPIREESEISEWLQKVEVLFTSLRRSGLSTGSLLDIATRAYTFVYESCSGDYASYAKIYGKTISDRPEMFQFVDVDVGGLCMYGGTIASLAMTSFPDYMFTDITRYFCRLHQRQPGESSDDCNCEDDIVEIPLIRGSSVVKYNMQCLLGSENPMERASFMHSHSPMAFHKALVRYL